MGDPPAGVREEVGEARSGGGGPDSVADGGAVGDAAAAGRGDPLAEALVVLCRLLKRPLSREALTAGLPLEGGRLTPALAVRALNRAGFAARLVQRPLARLEGPLLPCVLLLSGRQAVVLLGRDADGRLRVALSEVDGGVAEWEPRELEARYLGHALLAKPRLAQEAGDAVAAAPAGHWFWSVLWREWPLYGEVMAAALLINLFTLAGPLFIMNVYDRVVPNEAMATLWVLAVGALLAFGFDFVLRLLRGHVLDAAGRIADIRLASRIFAHVLGLEMRSRPASAGAFANHVREFESIREFFASATITTLIDLPFVLLFILVIWMVGGAVAAVPAVAVPLVLAAGLVLQIPLNRVIRRTFQEASRKHGVLVEAVSGLETIKSLGAEGHMQRAFEEAVAATAESANRARLYSSLTVHLAVLAANLVTVGVVVLGVYRIAAGEMTVGALVAATILAGRAMAPLGQVAGVLARFHQAKAAYETLNRIMRLATERPAGRRHLPRARLRGAVTFRSVTFRYPGQELPALREASFHIEPGERVALVGRVGSGKTTVAKLILGLYAPEQGAVLVDGVDVRQIDPAELRRQIGYVPQDVVLFRGTLRENILIAAEDADEHAFLRAATLAGVEDFAARHPQGYELRIGERGEALSGGQRQAVAIARALLRDPPLLLLDEPTSAMDSGAEERLKARLSPALAGRTLLLVTHRGSLLSLVERLIVLDAGRVVADGPRDEVIRALNEGRIRGAA